MVNHKQYINNLPTAKHEQFEYGCAGIADQWLKPLAGQQKSFYKKAYVLTNENISTLYSYGTAVMSYYHNRNEVRKEWGGWSATTAQHIEAFLGFYVPKKTLTSMKVCEVRKLEDIKA